MKLFLSSLAISDSQSNELAKLAGKQPKNIRLALIENAADTYAEVSRSWLDGNRVAIQKPLASLNKLMLENHLCTHVYHMLSSGDKTQEAKAVEELLGLYELNNIRGK